MAARDEPTIAQAAAEGLAYVVGQAEPAAVTAPHVATYRAAGGDAEVRAVRIVVVGPDDDAALDLARPAYELYSSLFLRIRYYLRERRTPVRLARARRLRRWARSHVLRRRRPSPSPSSSPSEMAIMGADRLDVMFQVPGLPDDVRRDSMRRFAAEVAPALTARRDALTRARRPAGGVMTSTEHGTAHVVTARHLSAESFSPYGEVLRPTADGSPPLPGEDRLDLSRGTPRFYLMQLADKPARFISITRHRQVTQCLAAVGGSRVAARRRPARRPRRPHAPAVAGLRWPGSWCPATSPSCCTGARGMPGRSSTPPTMSFFNLELADTNVVDHQSHSLAGEGVSPLHPDPGVTTVRRGPAPDGRTHRRSRRGRA